MSTEALIKGSPTSTEKYSRRRLTMTFTLIHGFLRLIFSIWPLPSPVILLPLFQTQPFCVYKQKHVGRRYMSSTSSDEYLPESTPIKTRRLLTAVRLTVNVKCSVIRVLLSAG